MSSSGVGPGTAAVAAAPSPEPQQQQRPQRQHDGSGGSPATDSESGSSYIGSDAPEDGEPFSPVCHWRTPRFHGDECSRFFDCPTHVIERVLSDDERDTGDNDGEEGDAEMGELQPADQHAPGDEGGPSTASAVAVGGQGENGPQRNKRTAPVAELEDRMSVDELEAESSSASGAQQATEPQLAENEQRRAALREELLTAQARLAAARAQLAVVRAGSSSTASNVPSGSTTPQPPTPTIVLDPPARSDSLANWPASRSPTQPAGAPVSPLALPMAALAGGSLSPTAGLSRTPEPRSPRLNSPAIRGRDGGLPSASESGLGSGPAQAGRAAPGSRTLPEIVLPRWQPDAEVTYCPICHTQFSIFVRKHHCRKCGRVVCNACSPHRITIPYQYIVHPPGQQPRVSAPQSPSAGGGSGSGGSYTDFSTLGGGERVRLCNPCVPDPNTTPPQPQDAAGQFGAARSHHRSQSTHSAAGFGNEGHQNRGGYFSAAPSSDAYSRTRSVTMASGAAGSSSRQAPYQSTQSRILAGTPPAYFPGSSSSGYQIQSRHRTLLDVGSSASSSSSPQQQHQQRALPPAPPPQPQIAEEDECPVCHRELPSRTLQHFESLRESHISSCIMAHSAYHGGSRSGSAPTGAGSGSSAGDDSSSALSASASPPLLSERRTGMFPYLATEKDCVDSAECTICLEEFEVGVPMARLECLCRFHRACISAWFVGHPGRCPVHQHDSFGF